VQVGGQASAAAAASLRARVRCRVDRRPSTRRRASARATSRRPARRAVALPAASTSARTAARSAARTSADRTAAAETGAIDVDAQRVVHGARCGHGGRGAGARGDCGRAGAGVRDDGRVGGAPRLARVCARDTAVGDGAALRRAAGDVVSYPAERAALLDALRVRSRTNGARAHASRRSLPQLQDVWAVLPPAQLANQLVDWCASAIDRALLTRQTSQTTTGPGTSSTSLRSAARSPSSIA